MDTFDFSLIDANTTLAGDQNFSSIVSSFTGAAGQLRIAATDEGVAVYGDTNGDRTADFAIEVKDVSTLSVTDFIL